jgi:hypothetical protein
MNPTRGTSVTHLSLPFHGGVTYAIKKPFCAALRCGARRSERGANEYFCAHAGHTRAQSATPLHGRWTVTRDGSNDSRHRSKLRRMAARW